MKKEFYFFLLFALSLLATKCKEESRGELRIRILPKYGTETLIMQNPVAGAQGYPMLFKRLSFFMELKDGDATMDNSDSNLAFVELSNLNTKAKAEIGQTISFNLLPGDYSSLNLGIGVPSSLNKKKPSDFSSSNPLSEVSEYWDAWDSYIFTKTEGAVDTAKNGKADLQFSYHTGTDEMFRNITLIKSFTIIENQTTEVVLELDVKEILNGKGGVVNPLIQQNAHSLSNKAVAIKISDNYLNSIK